MDPHAPSAVAAPDDGAAEKLHVSAKTADKGGATATKRRGRRTRISEMPAHIRPLPSMPALQDKYYSREGLPIKLANYRIPTAMREKMCRLLDEDEANSGLELLVSTLAHMDMERACGKVAELHRPFMLVFPKGVRVVKSEPEQDFIEFIVRHMSRNYPEVVINELALNTLCKFFDTTIKFQACPSIRHPCDIAAAAFLGFIMYNPFVDKLATHANHKARGLSLDDPPEKMIAICHQEAAVRAGAFLANIILLGENMPPLRDEEIASPLFALARAKDYAAWARDDSPEQLMHNDFTYAFFKELKRGCQKCLMVPPVLYRCSQCHVTQYCNRKCQEDDWVRHKLFCNQNRKAAAEYAKGTQ